MYYIGFSIEEASPSDVFIRRKFVHSKLKSICTRNTGLSGIVFNDCGWHNFQMANNTKEVRN